jgi:hypothetical protein
MAHIATAVSNNGALLSEPTITIARDAAWPDDSYLIIDFAVESVGGSVTTPGGWTAHPNNGLLVTKDGQALFSVIRKLVTADSSFAFTWTNGGASGVNYHCNAYTGRDPTSVAAATSFTNKSQDNTGGTSVRAITCPSGTANAGDDIHAFLAGDNGSPGTTITFNPFTGFTEATDVSDASFTSSATCFRENVSSGALGTLSGADMTFAGGGQAGSGVLLWALKAAAAGSQPGQTWQSRGGMGVMISM